MSRMREFAEDTLDWLEKKPDAKCPKCKKQRTPEGHDPCIANLPSVKHACCGHGIEKGFVYFTDGRHIEMMVLKVEQFALEPGDDGYRPHYRTDEAA